MPWSDEKRDAVVRADGGQDAGIVDDVQQAAERHEHEPHAP